MHLAPLISDLAVILAVAGLVTLIFQKIRQPVVLGYIIAGIIVGPNTSRFHFVSDLPSIKIWADLGVIFLMFSLGLEFSFRKLARVGVSAGLTALFEVFALFVCGFFAGHALGWTPTESVFLGAMVSISSTTIILRTLDEMKLKTRRFAQAIFGILIVEDLLAILLMVALSTFLATKQVSGLVLLAATGKLLVVVAAWFVSGYFLVPRLVRYVGRVGTNEMLTIVSLGLCLSLVTFAAQLNYSVALGAFIMGSILAESSESHRIEERIEPLRDLFAAIFFVSIGMLVNLHTFWAEAKTILVISLIVILGKSIFVTLSALATGQSFRGAVQIGTGLAQIGEFSFILAGLGVAAGVTRESIVEVAVGVSLLTTFTTPYFIRYSHQLALALEKFIPQRTREFLNRYSAWTQERYATPHARKEFFTILVKWLISAVVVLVAFVLSFELLFPVLSRSYENEKLQRFVAFALALLVSSPFWFSMFSLFRRFHFSDETSDVPHGGTVFIFRLFTVIWLGLVSLQFYPLKSVVGVTWAVLLLTVLAFRSQLSKTYSWFERKFLKTFDNQSKTQSKRDLLRSLAPWDAHLVRIKVHPNSDIVMKRLIDARLRVDRGMNVVAIQRGLKTIVAPKSTEVILPKDELLVLGDDEQIEIMKNTIEKPPGLADRFTHLESYELRKWSVHESSPFLGKSLKDSHIRDDFDAMVVGLERNENRMVNPDIEMLVELEDVLWIVGERESLDRLDSRFGGKS